MVRKQVSCGGRGQLFFPVGPTQPVAGDPWNGESKEAPGLLAQRPRLRNVAVLGQAGISIYTPAAEANPLAGIPERGTWGHWGWGLAARRKHMSLWSLVAHRRPRPPGLPLPWGSISEQPRAPFWTLSQFLSSFVNMSIFIIVLTTIAMVVTPTK